MEQSATQAGGEATLHEVLGLVKIYADPVGKGRLLFTFADTYNGEVFIASDGLTIAVGCEQHTVDEWRKNAAGIIDGIPLAVTNPCPPSANCKYCALAAMKSRLIEASSAIIDMLVRAFDEAAISTPVNTDANSHE